MGKREKAAVLMAILLAASSCGGDDDDEASDLGALDTPTFSEDGDDVVTSTLQVADPLDDPTATTDAGGSGTTATTGGEVRTETVGFDDPVGDATPGVGTGTPPPWTDLAGGSLERRGSAYRLTIRLGGAAPQVSEGSQTMNVATFFDVDDDGAVDYELWVNLDREGWGPVWYDDQNNAAIGDDSNVAVVVDRDEVRLLFPDVMLAKPARLRFSIASEYGALATIGTDLARRDDAPDNDQSVAFP